MKSNQTLFQHGTLAQLVPGLFAGTLTIGELLQHGDTGIGTLNGLDGELMILNGKVYQFSASGKIRLVGDSEMVPFANIHYRNDHNAGSLANLTFASFKKQLCHKLESLNLFYAVRVVGNFAYIRTRAVEAQKPPYPTLSATAAQQKEYQNSNITGTVIGYYCPELYAGVGSPGFHLHFLADNLQIGGHILDLKLNKATVYLQAFTDFNLHLPIHNQAFLQQKYDQQNIIDSIIKAEN